MDMSNTRKVYRWSWAFLLSALVFLILVLSIRQPAVQQFDHALIQMLDPLRTEIAVLCLSKLTDFGASRLLIPIIVLCSLYLLFKRKYASVILLPAGFMVERGLNTLLKKWIMRDRPDFVHLVKETGYSFPSGHAMNAATVYGLLLLLLVPAIPSAKWRRIWVVICLALILIVGFSRPFLRVHYLTDVLAGFAAGGFLVSTVALILLFIQKIKPNR